MGDPQVTIEFLATDQAILRSFQTVERSLLRMESRMTSVERASKQAGDTTSDAFSGAATQIKNLTSGLAGIGSAAGAVLALANQLRREWENLKSRQQDAASAQLDFATSLKQAIRNAGDLLSGTELETMSREAALRTGSTAAVAARAIGGALSARGPTNRAQALEAVSAAEAALRFAEELPSEDIKQLAGSALDIQKGQRKKVSPEAAIGLVQKVGTLSRTTELLDLVQHIAPAIANLNTAGVPIQTAGSLVAALTQGSADFTGRTSRTASVQLQRQLLERFPKLSLDEAIRKLQDEPKLRAKFFRGGHFPGGKFGEASFEAKEFGAVQSLLTKGSDVAKAFEEGKGFLGSFDDGLKTYKDLMQKFASVPSIMNQKVKLAFDSVKTDLQLLNVEGGKTSILREGLIDVMKASGLSATEQDLTRLGFEGEALRTGRAPVDHVIAKLRSAAGHKEHPTDVMRNLLGMKGPPASQEDLHQAKLLRGLADRIEQSVPQLQPQGPIRRDAFDALMHRDAITLGPDELIELGFQPFARGRQSETDRTMLADKMRARAKKIRTHLETRGEGGDLIAPPLPLLHTDAPPDQLQKADRLERAARDVEFLRPLVDEIKGLRNDIKQPQKVIDVTPKGQVPMKPLGAGFSR